MRDLWHVPLVEVVENHRTEVEVEMFPDAHGWAVTVREEGWSRYSWHKTYLEAYGSFCEAKGAYRHVTVGEAGWLAKHQTPTT